MRRKLSTADDDCASTYSASTTMSHCKDALLGGGGAEQGSPRRGLRQKARDVVSDLGSPPTARQDRKDGAHTSNFADLGYLTDLMQPVKT